MMLGAAMVLGACSQEKDSLIQPTQEQYSGSGNLSLEGELTLNAGESPRALSWDLVGANTADASPYSQNGAFRLRLQIGSELSIWTIVRSASQTKPLYVGQLKWTVVSDQTGSNPGAPARYRLRINKQNIRILDEALLANNDIYLSGLLFGKSGAAGQTFTFDPETLRLSITTPERASDHKDYLKSEYAQQQGIEQIPAVYTFDKLRISVSKNNPGSATPYKGIVSTGTFSPRGSVLRLISYIDTDYNLLTAATKKLDPGEPALGIYSRYTDPTYPYYNPQQLEADRQALLAEAKRITGNRAYLEPIGGVLRGVKDGYFDFAKEGIPFVATKTHDIEIPTIEPKGTRYNTLEQPSAAVAAANAKQGILNLWVASEEGSSTSAQFELETSFDTYLTVDKDYDDVGQDPKYPGTKGCYWTEERPISEFPVKPLDPTLPTTGDESQTSTTVAPWDKAPKKVLAVGLWTNDLKELLDAKEPATTLYRKLDSIKLYRVRGNKLAWEKFEHPQLPQPKWDLPYTLKFIAYLPRYDEPTRQTRKQTITLGKGRSYAGRLIYTIYAGGYSGRFSNEGATKFGAQDFGYNVVWSSLPE